MDDKADILARVCAAIDAGVLSEAAALIADDYPFSARVNVGRRYSADECTRVFFKDGFIDRYSGRKLVFPGALRLLSKLLPAEFPFQSNWKTDQCHFAYYELFPTIDHVTPVSRGGADSEENWITTSMLRNAAKANFTLEELGWHIRPAGDIGAWDGLAMWFVRQIDLRPEFRSDAYLARWAKAATRRLSQ